MPTGTKAVREALTRLYEAGNEAGNEAGRKEREGEIRETIVCVKCNGSGTNSGPGYFINCPPCSGTGILVDGVLNDILSLTPPTPEERTND